MHTVQVTGRIQLILPM